jgi:hypothetical protein
MPNVSMESDPIDSPISKLLDYEILLKENNIHVMWLQ